MSNDHVGIPRFIQRGFADKNRVIKYDLIRDKQYSESIDTLGTEKEYYDDDVEKEILASGIENQFSLIYNSICNTKKPDEIKQILDSNTKLVENFFSFMFLRAKKSLELVNKESLTSKIFGDLSHSDLLRIQTRVKVNPLQIIGNTYYFYPLINFSNVLFINNSIGFGFMINKQKQISIILPFNTRVAILISNDNELKDSDSFYIAPDGTNKTDIINKSISKMEKEYGNGFIFGFRKEEIEKYKNFIKEVYNKS